MSSGPPLTTSPPEGRPEFSGVRALVFLPGAAVLGALVGGAASVAQGWFAPLILFPLLVGIVLGAVLVALLRTTQAAHRATLIVGTLLAVTAATAGQHYAAYRVWVHRLDAKSGLARVAFADQLPNSFPEFLRWEARRGRTLLNGRLWPGLVARDGWAWASWGADALLALLGTLAMVLPALALPYCRHCRSWYHTTRSGRLKRPFAQRLAELFQLAVPERVKRIRYRLLGCEGGCEPLGLELHWRRRGADGRPPLVWLTDRGRDEVQRVLDEARTSRTSPKS